MPLVMMDNSVYIPVHYVHCPDYSWGPSIHEEDIRYGRRSPIWTEVTCRACIAWRVARALVVQLDE